MSILETLQKAKEIKPIAEKDGVKIVTFEDAATLANAEHIEPTADTGMRTYNPDGSLARTRKLVSAINIDNYFANKYKVKAKKLYVVTDYRAIKEYTTGRCYVSTLPCYVFIRNDKGDLEIEKITSVSDTEFLSDFTNTLDAKSMSELLPLMADFGSDITATELPI